MSVSVCVCVLWAHVCAICKCECAHGGQKLTSDVLYCSPFNFLRQVSPKAQSSADWLAGTFWGFARAPDAQTRCCARLLCRCWDLNSVFALVHKQVAHWAVAPAWSLPLVHLVTPAVLVWRWMDSKVTLPGGGTVSSKPQPSSLSLGNLLPAATTGQHSGAWAAHPYEWPESTHPALLDILNVRNRVASDWLGR